MSEDKLYVVSLPIGNLAELTFLAKQVLTDAKLIICEDTRNIRNFFKLNNWPDQQVTFISYHKFNEASRINEICQKLKQKHSGVLVSDAGYPGICDPGSRLIQACHQNKIQVQVVNGPCALLHCLVASGWSDYPWLFAGFAAHSANQIQKQLKQYQQFKGIIGFYVSLYAIEDFVESIEKIFGNDCEICIGRELTKKYEEILIGKISSLKNQLKLKGEFVFLINNLEPKVAQLISKKRLMLEKLISLGVEKRKACQFLGKYCFNQAARKFTEEIENKSFTDD